MDEECFLTEKQIDVLKKRKKGQTLDQIAKALNTTRQNISSIEKSAEKNIARARKTVEMARLLDAPVWLSLNVDTDLDSALGAIYEKANEKGLHLPYDGITIGEIIKRQVPEKLRGRRILFKIDVGVTKAGELIVV